MRRRASAILKTALAATLGITTASITVGQLASPPALAQGTPGLVEFRWDSSKDYRKLYYFMTDTQKLKRAEYYLILKPKDRKTAFMKLSIGIPKSFDAEIKPNYVQLCYMKEGGMLGRTRCQSTIPAKIEVAPENTAIDIYPDTPVPVGQTVGVYINLFNPFNAGMYQFNALAQAPGDVPVSGYLGSWLIQIDP